MINLATVQDAFGLILEADAAVTAALGSHTGRILGGTDPTATFPYVTIGEDEPTDASVQALEAKSLRMTIHIWTKEGGFAQCKTVEAAIVAALDSADGHAMPAGLRCVSCFHERSRFMRDPVNGIRHGVVEFTADIEAEQS